MTELPIIIPVKSRLRLTRQTIETLTRSTTLPYRLIIVSDNSDEETTEYIMSLPESVEKILLPESMGPGYARNIGMKAAGESELYYQSDCDMYFLPGWLEALYKAMETYPDLGIVGGRNHPHHGMALWRQENGVGLRLSDQQVGMTMLYRKKVWEDAGPFKHNPSSPDMMGQEDTAFCNRAQEAGWKVGAVIPHVVLHCGIRNTFNRSTAGYEEEIKQPFPADAIYE